MPDVPLPIVLAVLVPALAVAWAVDRRYRPEGFARVALHLAAALLVAGPLGVGAIKLATHLPDGFHPAGVLTIGQLAAGYGLVTGFWVLNESAGRLAPRRR